MNLPRSVRILIAMGVLVLSLAALLLILTISETTLNIRSHLERAPAWFGYAWWGMIVTASLLTGWLLWRILRPSAPRTTAPTTDTTSAPSESQLESSVDAAEELGVDYISLFTPLINESGYLDAVADNDGAHPRAAGYEAMAKVILESGKWWGNGR